MSNKFQTTVWLQTVKTLLLNFHQNEAGQVKNYEEWFHRGYSIAKLTFYRMNLECMKLVNQVIIRIYDKIQFAFPKCK